MDDTREIVRTKEEEVDLTKDRKRWLHREMSRGRTWGGSNGPEAIGDRNLILRPTVGQEAYLESGRGK